MENVYDIERFEDQQTPMYLIALSELRRGHKESHWMWFFFPQLRTLGRSYMAVYYGLSGVDEARRFLAHETFGPRFREMCDVILQLETNDPVEVFDTTDSKKLKSSMTLFDIVSPNDIFARVLDKYFGGKRCQRTLKIVASRQ